MDLLFNKEKQKDSLVAVFDIGSASVGGLLFKKRENYLPEVVASTRQPVNFPSGKNFLRTWPVINKAFVFVANYFKKEYAHTPNSALCVFSSPWYISQARVIKIERDENFEVTENLISDLIQDEMKLFKKQWDKSSFFEYAPIKTVLNGYNVENPLGKKTHNLELYAYLSLAPAALKEKIEKEILNRIHPQNIYLHSFPFVLFKTLENIIDIKDGAIFLDIKGEITDVFVFRDNIIEEINSFPIGENFFIRKLADVFNLGFDEAGFRFLQYQRNELDKNYYEKTKFALTAAVNDWGAHLEKMFVEIAKDKFLPQNLYFCGSASTVFLKEIILKVSDKNFEKFTIFNKPFDAHLLLPDSLKHHFDFAKGFSANKDIFLLTSALFANKFLRC
ncbi:hypothetical protein KKB69_00875 [Patescibacteria group bacterium]|nr:hypothetical protein [Patescibacteria group bacterium]